MLARVVTRKMPISELQEASGLAMCTEPGAVSFHLSMYVLVYRRECLSSLFSGGIDLRSLSSYIMSQ